MTHSRPLRLIATGLLAVLAVCGCTPKPGDPTPTPTPQPSVTASETPTPTPTPVPSPSTDRERAATDAVLAYIKVVDKLGADPSSNLDELNTVATLDALAQMQYILQNYRIDGWRQVGQQVPSFMAATPGSSALEWTISMCIDVSGVDVLDAQGNSVKNPDGVPRILVDYEVVESLAATQWYVALETAIETC